MKREWADVQITEVSVAVYVPPNTGKHIHQTRPFHGFVLNDENAVRDYCFSDGRVMRTKENTLFYLPKGSSYHVNTLCVGGCYAINFDAEIADEPFAVRLRNAEDLKKGFKIACDEWKARGQTARVSSMRGLYDAIYRLLREQAQDYTSTSQRRLIAPAVEELERNFTNGELTVSHLSALCGISEVYFRKIFIGCFGISPKEYLIRKRMEYASQLLSLREMEVLQVATICGYAEPCHFSREFKKRYGVSPKNYL